MTKFEAFVEIFNNLDLSDRVAIYNEYHLEYGGGYDDNIFEFDDDNINELFSTPMDALRAAHFGNIESWNDPYFRLNGYGNIQTMYETQVEEWIEGNIRDIFEHQDVWLNYITDEDFEDFEIDDEETEDDDESED